MNFLPQSLSLVLSMEGFLLTLSQTSLWDCLLGETVHLVNGSILGVFVRARVCVYVCKCMCVCVCVGGKVVKSKWFVEAVRIPVLQKYM